MAYSTDLRRNPSLTIASYMWLSVILAGCGLGPTLYGSFNEKGFHHTEYGYSVLATSGKQTILPNHWQLDNYFYSGNQLISKRGADYEITTYVDVNTDGVNDEIGKYFTYDLRFTHVRNAGVIWLRTNLISKKSKYKELRILARSYIEHLSGTHYEVVQLQGRLILTTSEKSYATTVIEENTGMVAGQEAYTVTLDVADVQQLQLSPDSRKKRVRLVFIRTPFIHTCITSFGGAYHSREYKIPVLMIAGYANLVEDFKGGVNDFENFLSRIVIGGKRSVRFTEVTQRSEDASDQKETVEQTPQPKSESPPVPGKTH